MRAYKHGGWAHRQRVSTTFFTLKKNLLLGFELSQFFVVAPDRVRTSGLWISSPTFYQLSHPVTPVLSYCDPRKGYIAKCHPSQRVHREMPPLAEGTSRNAIPLQACNWYGRELIVNFLIGYIHAGSGLFL